VTRSSTAMSSAVALLEAIEAGELVVHYQAIYRLGTSQVCGFEALVRWDHPTQGLLGPDSFLPSDMGGGLGWALTNFVLEEAIRQCAEWRAAGQDVGVSVNISPGPLADELLPTQVCDLLERYGVPPEALTVEITEHRCAIDPGGIAVALGQLARAGVRLSLDDFGTGESSLARLRELRFDELKIDRCFIIHLADKDTDQHIVRFITELAHQLGCTVVAEGIEAQAALQLLNEMGVECGQGYLLHRPAAPAAPAFSVHAGAQSAHRYTQNGNGNGNN
jgi:EAL domain-containing protein (putative c-di-GMP-specific phosphodiesterase class I)